MTGSDNDRWFVPRGVASRGGWELHLDDTREDWAHTGLRVAELAPGRSLDVPSGPWEHLVVPLRGGVDVVATAPDGTVDRAELAGRSSVFDGPTDVAFAPAGSGIAVTGAAEGSRVAVCAAKVSGAPTAPFRHVGLDEVPVELRGAGSCSREVRNFGVPAVLDADAMIACEVVTPGGNWSSYPPHKHDEERAGQETELEEIYYFESQGVGYQRVYGTAERPVDVLAEVRTGDVVLVAHGWHGPSMAAPGYDLYYLNVMAGPGPVRAWLICDDPAHTWVRRTWEQQAVDPRLPTGGAG